MAQAAPVALVLRVGHSQVQQISSLRASYLLVVDQVKDVLFVLLDLRDTMRQCEQDLLLHLHLVEKEYPRSVRRDLKQEVLDRMVDIIWRMSTELLQMQVARHEPFSGAGRLNCVTSSPLPRRPCLSVTLTDEHPPLQLYIKENSDKKLVPHQSDVVKMQFVAHLNQSSAKRKKGLSFLVDEEKSVASHRIAHGAKLGPAVGQLDTRGRHEGGKWRMGTGKAVRNALCAEHMHA